MEKKGGLKRDFLVKDILYCLNMDSGCDLEFDYPDIHSSAEIRGYYVRATNASLATSASNVMR